MRRHGRRLQRIPAAAASAATKHQRRRRPWCAALQHNICFIWGSLCCMGVEFCEEILHSMQCVHAYS